MKLFDIILECAKIPSFSSYEERIHPWIQHFISSECKNEVILERIPDNNLILSVPGKRNSPPVALTAHLDKIDHYGRDDIKALDVQETKTKLIGQMDDSVGVGICLYLLQQSQTCNFPPLYILFSEMEESFGMKRHRSSLRKGGNGLEVRMGAERIAEHLLKTNRVPSLVLTVDTTPLFGGRNGIALYSNHWEISGMKPSMALQNSTEKWVSYFQKIHEAIQRNNNTNDYVTYGEILNRGHGVPVPSLAIEPSIYPYHTIGEAVFKSDVEKVVEILITFLATSCKL